MNEFVNMILLSIVQGFSEWFPISSSGHLVLASKLIGYANSVEFDVALHFGTLMAVFVYFGKDIIDMIEAVLKRQWKRPEAKMALLLIIATIPAGLVGYFFKKFIESAFDSLAVVALGFAITGIVLFIASLDFNNRKERPSYWDSILIGCAQAVAILPGVSRSGSTISSGLLLGLDERTALRFSFLMSIPVIFGASLLEIGNSTLPASYVLPTFLAFIVGMLTIHVLFKVVVSSKKNLRWFGLYVLLLALGIGIYLLFF